MRRPPLQPLGLSSSSGASVTPSDGGGDRDGTAAPAPPHEAGYEAEPDVRRRDPVPAQPLLPRTPARTRWTIAGEPPGIRLPESIQVVRRPTVDLEVVLPLIKHGGPIAPILAEIRAHLQQQPCLSSIVVVGDASSVDRAADDVTALADIPGPPIYLISCSRRGQGAAIRRGILTSAARFVALCDPDFPESMHTLAAIWPLLAGNRVVVAAGAQHAQRRPESFNAHPFPATRKIRDLVTRRLPALLVDPRCTCSFFDAHVARRLLGLTTLNGRGLDLELLWLARVGGLNIAEVMADRPDGNAPPTSVSFPTLAVLPILVDLARGWRRHGADVHEIVGDR